MNRFFTTDEKDAIKHKAEQAYIQCYGHPGSKEEAFYVMKGIEAMAAVVYTAIDKKLSG